MEIYVSTFDLNGFSLSKELWHWQSKHILRVKAANVHMNTHHFPVYQVYLAKTNAVKYNSIKCYLHEDLWCC